MKVRQWLSEPLIRFKNLKMVGGTGLEPVTPTVSLSSMAVHHLLSGSKCTQGGPMKPHLADT
jgi:hypothetical protein